VAGARPLIPTYASRAALLEHLPVRDETIQGIWYAGLDTQRRYRFVCEVRVDRRILHAHVQTSPAAPPNLAERLHLEYPAQWARYLEHLRERYTPYLMLCIEDVINDLLCFSRPDMVADAHRHESMRWLRSPSNDPVHRREHAVLNAPTRLDGIASAYVPQLLRALPDGSDLSCRLTYA
jgi:hypothetical protein